MRKLEIIRVCLRFQTKSAMRSRLNSIFAYSVFLYTVARIDQESGNYMILPMTFHTTEGPQTHGTYIWGEFDDLQAIEDRLIDGPYIHHFVEIEGDMTKEIKEFCKYFPNLKIDRSLEK